MAARRQTFAPPPPMTGPDPGAWGAGPDIPPGTPEWVNAQVGIPPGYGTAGGASAIPTQIPEIPSQADALKEAIDNVMRNLGSSGGGDGGQGPQPPTPEEIANAQLGLNLLRDQLWTAGRQWDVTQQGYGLQGQQLDINKAAQDYALNRQWDQDMSSATQRGAIGTMGLFQQQGDIAQQRQLEGQTYDINKATQGLQTQSGQLGYNLNIAELSTSINQLLNSWRQFGVS